MWHCVNVLLSHPQANAVVCADIAEATRTLACTFLGKHHELTPEEYQAAVQRGDKSGSELHAQINKSVAMLEQEDCVMCVVPHRSSSDKIESESELGSEPEPEPERSRETKHDLKSLRDLRSRALLYVNTSFQKRDDDEEGDDEQKIAADMRTREHMRQFDRDIRILEDIVDNIVKLCRAGHFGFRSFSQALSREGLEDLRKHTTQELKQWKENLAEARKEFHWLQYFRSGHLLHIHDSFRGQLDGKNRSALDSILRFAMPYFNVDDSTGFDVSLVPLPVPDYSEETKDELAVEQIQILGRTLHRVMKWKAPPKAARIVTNQSEDDRGMQISKPKRVEPGRLKVFKVVDEVNTLSCIMALFLGTEVAPEANQTLFCQQSTSEEEVEMLLYRCFSAPVTDTVKSKLHCIVNPERLDGHVQNFLMEEIRRATISVRKGEEPQGQASLALVCCEEVRGHILGQFVDCEDIYRAGNSADTTATTLREQLKSLTLGQQIITITSTHPGLGKTELIGQHAHREMGVQVRTVPVSGPVDVARLVARLHQAKLHNVQDKLKSALHLDISTVTNAPDLNIFIFQLLVLGTVSCGTEFFHLPAQTSVYLEIANAGSLRDSLPVCLPFQIGNPRSPMVLHWSMDRFIFSEEVQSPIQVVCIYLNALYSRTLDGQDIVLSDETAVVRTRCVMLLRKYFAFVQTKDCSFSVVDVFVRVLADQVSP